MNYLLNMLIGKTDRAGYVISILVVIWGFYFFGFCINLTDRCYGCNPPEIFPWRELLELLIAIGLGGVYVCILLVIAAYDVPWVGISIIIPMLLTAFYFLQTIKRCYDISCSCWRSLLPLHQIIDNVLNVRC